MCCSEDLSAEAVSNYPVSSMQKRVMSGSYLFSVPHILKNKQINKILQSNIYGKLLTEEKSKAGNENSALRVPFSNSNS